MHPTLLYDLVSLSAFMQFFRLPCIGDSEVEDCSSVAVFVIYGELDIYCSCLELKFC